MSSNWEEKVARRYSKALFNGCPPSDFDLCIKELTRLSEVWEKSSEFRSCMSNPRITDSKRIEILNAILTSFGEQSSALVRRTAEILVADKRAKVFPKLAEFFKKYVQEYRRALSLEVTTTKLLSAEEMREMKDRLSKALGGEVELNNKSDTEILGGLMFRVGDKLLDRSVAGTLSRIAERLI